MADTMDVIQRLRDRTRKDGPSLVWLLVPWSSSKGRARPRIADIAVPVDRQDFDRVPVKLVRDGRLVEG